MRRFAFPLALLSILAFLAAAVLGYGAWQLQIWLRTPVKPPVLPVVIVVRPGATFRQVAENLLRVGVIGDPISGDPIVMRYWARYNGTDRGVRSGEFVFDRAMTPPEVMEKLHASESRSLRVTFAEGLSVAQIVEILEDAGLGGRDVYECLMRDPHLLAEYRLPATGIEGYLFPDTYDFEPGSDPREVLRRMLERFRVVSAELENKRRLAGMSEKEMVILASIVERETGSDGERAKVAGVFHNRLRKGMKLQSDPTIIYGRDGDWREPILKSDITNPHLYNTYVHTGLPPGPIANPGRAALAAAVDPEETDAIFFVSRNDGTHVFSRTLREHNRAVNRYQRRRKK